MIEQSYPTALVRALRQELASVISDFSANDVPSLCARLGLAEGDREESFKSKFKYAQRRLLEVPAADLAGIADGFLRRSTLLPFQKLRAASVIPYPPQSPS